MRLMMTPNHLGCNTEPLVFHSQQEEKQEAVTQSVLKAVIKAYTLRDTAPLQPHTTATNLNRTKVSQIFLQLHTEPAKESKKGSLKDFRTATCTKA